MSRSRSQPTRLGSTDGNLATHPKTSKWTIYSVVLVLSYQNKERRYEAYGIPTPNPQNKESKKERKKEKEQPRLTAQSASQTHGSWCTQKKKKKKVFVVPSQ